MGKVSIGLRGWRFDEADVFTEAGDWRPLEAMPEDARRRVQRLTALVNSPCDACWLVHGEENVEQCAVSAVVYGEPMAEVTLCDDHEVDFLYWFREAGGSDHRGSEALPDAFHEWFAGGGRAPDGYAGVEHVETDPESVPEPEKTADVGDLEVTEDVGSPTDTDLARGGSEVDPAESDLDRSRDYPS